MTKDHAVDIALLHLRDAHEFAPLLASYAQALKRGAPRRPDDFYAEHLLQDRAAEALGARVDGNLVGFVIFYDLPEPVTGLRAGQVDITSMSIMTIAAKASPRRLSMCWPTKPKSVAGRSLSSMRRVYPKTAASSMNRSRRLRTGRAM